MKTQIFKITAAVLLLSMMSGSASDKTDDGYLVLSTAAYHFKNFR